MTAMVNSFFLDFLEYICKCIINRYKNTRRVGDNQFPLDQICLGVNNTNHIKLEWYGAHSRYSLQGDQIPPGIGNLKLLRV